MQEPERSISVKCWACCQKSEAPIYHGTAVSIIKCWYCGALIEDIQLEENCGGGGGNDGVNIYMSDITNDSTDSSPLPLLKQRSTPHQALGYAMVAFVFLVTTTVAGSGIFFALPGSMSDTPLSPALPFLQIVAGIIYLSILSTYITIITSHPGPVRYVAVQARTAEAIEQGAFNDWRWCKLCRQGKSPTAHHCRRCAMCVQGLDHHCLFTANRCIGAGNIEPFLWFLVLLIIGCIFAFIAAAGMGWRNQRLIETHTRATWGRPLFFNSLLLHALTFLWRWVLTAPMQLAGWALAFTLSLSTGVGIALLLHRSLKLKYRGSTVLGELQRRRQELQAAIAGNAGTDMGAPGGEFGQNAVHNMDICKPKAM